MSISTNVCRFCRYLVFSCGNNIERTKSCEVLVECLIDKGCTTDSSLQKDLRASIALHCATERPHNSNLLFFKWFYESPSSSYKNIFEISQKAGKFEWPLSLLTENYHLTDKSLLSETAFSEMLISLLLHMEIRGMKIYLLAFPRVLFVHNFIIFLTLSSHSSKGGFISKGSIQLICNKVLLLK